MSDYLKTSAQLTHKNDTAPHTIRLKVFWKTTRYWTPEHIENYHRSVLSIAKELKEEKYWSSDGDIHLNTFTCEDFAIHILCKYAHSKGLPVKLTTGVRTYRNMEEYNSEDHEQFAANMWGFSAMVMLTYGASDMQRTGKNTLPIAAPENLLPGDILALSRENSKEEIQRAHHIQIVTEKTENKIKIFQGNSKDTIIKPITWIYRLAGKNIADPFQDAYGGKEVETGYFTKRSDGWDYKNKTTGEIKKNNIKYFEYFRWNFEEFNK